MRKDTVALKVPLLLQWFNPTVLEQSVQERLRLTFFLQYTTIHLVASLAFSLLCLSSGYNNLSLIPLSFIVLTLFNVYLSNGFKEYAFKSQVFLGILIPFIIQYQLGGIFKGGFFMLWSVMSLMCCQSFLKQGSLVALLIAFSVLLIVSTFAEYKMLDGRMVDRRPVLWMSFNFLLVVMALFTCSNFYLQSQKKMIGKLRKQSNEMKVNNKRMNREIHLASCFQKGTLPASLKFKSRFKQHFVAAETKGDCAQNIYWIGDYFGKEIIITINGEWDQLLSAMLTMVTHSHLKELVYREGVHDAQRILSSLSGLISTKLEQDLHQERGTCNINVLTYDWTANALENAGYGFNLFIQDDMRKGSIKAIANMGVKCPVKVAPNAELHAATLGYSPYLFLFSPEFKLPQSDSVRSFEDLVKATNPDKKELNLRLIENELRSRQNARQSESEEGHESLVIGLDLSHWD